MSVITVLPTRRLNELTDRARLLELPVEQQRQHRQHQQLAAVVVDARTRTRISQAELARRIGVASAAVNQWESAGSQPTGLHLARLLRELPDLKELLEDLDDQHRPRCRQADSAEMRWPPDVERSAAGTQQPCIVITFHRCVPVWEPEGVRHSQAGPRLRALPPNHERRRGPR